MRPSVSGILGIVVDAFRVSAAFRAAGRGNIDQAMRELSRVGEFTSKTFEVRLLKGALYSHMKNHLAATDELLAAVRAVKADSRVGAADANYLIAYAFQYWAYSAHEIGLQPADEAKSILKVQSPVETNSVSSHLRTKFPLKVPLQGIVVR